MIAPSINPERLAGAPDIWSQLTISDIQDMIVVDVAELRALYTRQAEDAVEAALTGRQLDYRIRTLIKAWENTQDEHWSWLKEIQNANANSGAAQGP